LREFYKLLGASPLAKLDLQLGHGFPTPNGRVPCDQTRFPFTNKCNYDGSGEILRIMYGNLEPAREEVPLSIAFKQSEFAESSSQLSEEGHVFIPEECKVTSCKVHVALHGCVQSPAFVSRAFTDELGFNRWADANDIILLYPAVNTGRGNPQGCWDWFGYTGTDYARRDAPQMRAIVKMVQRLTSKR
ncbi:MAG: hypothetical protein EOP06_09000, partial [Proteobacteria bacterium]